MPRIPSGEVKQRLLEARDNQDDGIPFERVRAQLGVLTPRLSRILPWWIEQDRKKALKIVKLVGGLGALASPPAHTSGEVASAEETQKGVQTQVRFVRSVQ